MSDEQEIRDHLERWAASVRARHMPGILAGHAPDVRLFNVPEPEQQSGLDAYRQALQLYLDNAPTPTPYALSEIAITVSGDAAFASMMLDCHGGGRREPDALRVRVTVCFRREADAWMVVHEHHSVPIRLD